MVVMLATVLKIATEECVYRTNCRRGRIKITLCYSNSVVSAAIRCRYPTQDDAPLSLPCLKRSRVSSSLRRLTFGDLRSKSLSRVVVNLPLVCDYFALLSSPQPTTPFLQRVSKPLDIADRSRIHVWDRFAEKDIASVTRAVDGPAVYAHPGRQEHLIIFQAFVPQGV